MRLTTKGRYAVTAMLDLAYHSKENPITLTDIATRQTISLSYLEQLFSRLRHAGMVQGVRGPGGGYTLSRDATEISIAEIITAVDEKIDATNCEGRGDCQDGLPCLTHDLWMGLSTHIREYLNGISLDELLEKDHVQQIAERQDYQAQDVIVIHNVA